MYYGHPSYVLAMICNTFFFLVFSDLEISRELQQSLFGTSNNKTAAFKTESTKDETSSTKLKGLEVLSTKDQVAVTRRPQPELMLDEVDEDIGG
jgi:hypothetical protein